MCAIMLESRSFKAWSRLVGCEGEGVRGEPEQTPRFLAGFALGWMQLAEWFPAQDWGVRNLRYAHDLPIPRCGCRSRPYPRKAQADDQSSNGRSDGLRALDSNCFVGREEKEKAHHAFCAGLFCSLRRRIATSWELRLSVEKAISHRPGFCFTFALLSRTRRRKTMDI